jgi:hypothetical protein
MITSGLPYTAGTIKAMDIPLLKEHMPQAHQGGIQTTRLGPGILSEKSQLKTALVLMSFSKKSWTAN